MNNFENYWDKIHLNYTSTYDKWLNKYIHLIKKEDSIVELGCGRAYCSKYLLDNGFKNIIACDFSEEVLKIVNTDIPSLKTKSFDMSKGLLFEDNSINVLIADLSLHYFNLETTKFIFDEIYRILKKDGYLIARVNSFNNIKLIPNTYEESEKNFFYDGNIYRKFFDKNELELLFRNFETCNLVETEMNRYENPKILWEFCIKKI